MKLWVVDISGIYKLRSKNPEFRRNPEKFHPCFEMKKDTHTLGPHTANPEESYAIYGSLPF